MNGTVAQWTDGRDSLVMSGVWDAAVHSQFVALHLVELVSGVGILSWLYHCRPHIQVLIKVLPPDLTWKTHARTCAHAHTHTQNLSALKLKVKLHKFH